jgi:hypothetical protein
VTDEQQSASGGVISSAATWIGSCVIEPPTPPVIQITGEAGVIVAIHPDGTVELGPGVSADEAARGFWDAVLRMADGMLSSAAWRSNSGPVTQRE